MILQTVELRVVAGQETAFEADLCDTRQRVFGCQGFRGFAAFQGATDPSEYLVHVRWETLEELHDAIASGRLAECFAPLESHLDGAPRNQVYLERPGLAFQGPGVITEPYSA